jgi:HK97 family phage prohead protease
MPYPNEHACRILDPGQFVRFKRDNTKNPNVIIGFRKDGSSDLQAFRYPKDDWTADRAGKHCSEHEGRFEPAGESSGKPELERRYNVGLEMRVEGDTARRLVGYAAVFNQRTQLSGDLYEQIAPGAFKNSIEQKRDVRALLEHEGGLNVLGRTVSGTLALAEDEKGLRCDILLPDTSVARDVATLVGRGDLSQMSFAFRTITDEWKMEDGVRLRTLREVELWDVSVVTFPAYEATSVALRSLEGWLDGQAEVVQGTPRLDAAQEKLRGR